jgi:hypothetical protein
MAENRFWFHGCLQPYLIIIGSFWKDLIGWLRSKIQCQNEGNANAESVLSNMATAI